LSDSVKKEPTRVLNGDFDDNGRPYWRSCTSPKNVKVRGECKLPVHLPGIIIFVHGVNSTGEWYEVAEDSLCKGLNKRLGLVGTDYSLSANIYSCDKKYKEKTKRKIMDEGRSPVVRFYWGYRAADGEEGKYQVPLININNEDYHDLILRGESAAVIQSKGPFYWEGGPFQNGTTQLVSLWSNEGFKGSVAGVPTQLFAPDLDRLLTDAPPRHYYSHAAQRLASLLDTIRDKYPNDTVSVISHSQGTMIATAATALAKKAPDALFILNSPYALDTKLTDKITLPSKEVITDNARSLTLSSIIEKISKQSSHLSSRDHSSLCVGKTFDNKSWSPSALLEYVGNSTPDDVRYINERDNHGRFYIYCNPHDRVMGSSPLLSVGWQGLPNGKDGKPHPLLVKYKGIVFQRMMARSTPCGSAPDPYTAFSPLPDGKPFWDDGENGLVYSVPEKKTININAEMVTHPIPAVEMIGFDESRVGVKEIIGIGNGPGWGQTHTVNNSKNEEPNDDTFDNYINMYPYEMVATGYKYLDGISIPNYRRETNDERRARVGKYISQPTDHSTLPSSIAFMERVVAYDIPIGFCESTWDKEFSNKIRTYADWTLGDDPYMKTGRLNIPVMPSIISTERIEKEEIESLKSEAINNGWYPGSRSVNKL
jgi:hypothetical protein